MLAGLRRADARILNRLSLDGTCKPNRACQAWLGYDMHCGQDARTQLGLDGPLGGGHPCVQLRLIINILHRLNPP